MKARTSTLSVSALVSSRASHSRHRRIPPALPALAVVHVGTPASWSTGQTAESKSESLIWSHFLICHGIHDHCAGKSNMKVEYNV